MKKLLIITLFGLMAGTITAQPIFDLGLKGGFNCSKISLSHSDYNESTITKMHYGAFARLGISKIFIQPEVYFTKKGGEFKLKDVSSKFDYSAVDVPVLLGFKFLDVKTFSLHAMAGPVFGFVTDKKIDTSEFSKEYFEDNYCGIQYGIGADILFLTIDLRMEQGSKVFEQLNVKGKNNNFMVTVGIKLL